MRAQRPSNAQLLEAAEAKKDAAEGSALPPLVRAVEVRRTRNVTAMMCDDE